MKALRDEFESNDHIIQMVKSLCQGDYMRAIISIHSAFKKAAQLEQRIPIFIDHGSHITKGGQIITVDSIRRVIRRQIEICGTKLRGIFGSVALIDIPANLTDDVNSREIGCSIFTQNKAKLIKGQPLYCYWKQIFRGLCGKYSLYNAGFNSNGLNEVAVNEFFTNHYNDIATDLMVLMHVTGGSPARKTELATIRIVNSANRHRNIFLDGDNIYYAVAYHKTTQQRNNYRPTFHFVPPVVSKLIFNFICLLHPAMMAAKRICNSNFLAPTKFIQVKKPHAPVEISARFERVMAEQEGISMTFREWRHLVPIYLREELCLAVNAVREAEQIDLQSGRSYLTGVAVYGLASNVISGATTDQICRERALSLSWHRKMMLNEGDQNQPTIMPTMTPTIKSTMTPTRPNTFVSPRANIAQTTPGRNSNVVCPDAIIQCLRELYGNTPTLSPQNIKAIQLVLQRQNDIFIHLPTGSGKSNSFIVPAKLEPHMCNIVFVPLVALLLDISAKCTSLGLNVVTWNGINTEPKSIVLVHYSMDIEMVRQFSSWLDFQAQSGKIGRIIFDEAHLLVEWHDFMQLNPLSQVRGAIAVQIVFQSATLPLQVIARIKEMFSLHSSDIILIEEIRPRENLEIIRTASENTTKAVHELLRQHFINNTGPNERAIIFVPTLARLAEVKTYLQQASIPCCEFYGDMGRQKSLALRNWKLGSNGVKTIISTKAMNAGVDYGAVHFVAVLDYVNSFCDLVQSFGRAGRDKSAAKCHFISNFSLVRNPNADKRLRALFDTNMCLRYVMDLLMYGWGTPCNFIMDSIAKHCSNCLEKTSQSALNVFDDMIDINFDDDETILMEMTAAHDQFPQSSSIRTGTQIAKFNNREDTMIGGLIAELMDRLNTVCPFCIVNNNLNMRHSIITCTQTRRACNECVVRTDHYAKDCPTRSIAPTNRCCRCWLSPSYGNFAVHPQKLWAKNCPNKQWYGLIKMWACTFWMFRDRNIHFANCIQSFASRNNCDCSNLDLTLRAIGTDPELFLTLCKDMLDEINL